MGLSTRCGHGPQSPLPFGDKPERELYVGIDVLEEEQVAVIGEAAVDAPELSGDRLGEILVLGQRGRYLVPRRSAGQEPTGIDSRDRNGWKTFRSPSISPKIR